MYGPCSMHGDENCIWGFGGESQNKTDPLEDIDVD
jgi:hypothetical protein